MILWWLAGCLSCWLGTVILKLTSAEAEVGKISSFRGMKTNIQILVPKVCIFLILLLSFFFPCGVTFLLYAILLGFCHFTQTNRIWLEVKHNLGVPSDMCTENVSSHQWVHKRALTRRKNPHQRNWIFIYNVHRNKLIQLTEFI